MSKKNPKKIENSSHKVVFVKWFDTYSTDAWQTLKDAKKWGGAKYETKSIGWLIDESDDHILLAGGVSFDKKANLFIHIPKVNIIEQIEIEL